jgi:NTP pyrophosphatase (non-canonical NTP hydrolase)
VWQSPEQSRIRVIDRKESIASEMADIAILLFEMAEASQISLGEAITAKLARNAEKYPVEKAHGSNRKYNEL